MFLKSVICIRVMLSLAEGRHRISDGIDDRFAGTDRVDAKAQR